MVLGVGYLEICKTSMLKFTHDSATEEYTAVLTAHVFVSVYSVSVYFSEASERRWFISIRLYRGLRVCLAQRYSTAEEAMVDAQTEVLEYLRTLSTRVQEALQGVEGAQDPSGSKTALERVMEGELF